MNAELLHGALALLPDGSEEQEIQGGSHIIDFA